MKKLTSIILAIATIFSITTSAFATEAPYTREVTLRGSVKIVYNGNEQALRDVAGNIVVPIFFDGSHYLPLRALSGLAGLNVEWDGATRTVILTSGATPTAADGKVKYTDAQIKATISPDVTVTLDGVKQSFADAAGNAVYPVIYNGTTYLPARAVGELVGLNIDWDGTTKTVIIETSDYEAPVETSTGTQGIAPIPEGNIIATESMAYDSGILATGSGTQHWLTEAECKKLGVVNGIVIDKSTAHSPYAGVGFSGVSYSSISYSIVAPSDVDVKTNVYAGSGLIKTKTVDGSIDCVVAGTISSYTVYVEGHSFIGINAAAIAEDLYYIVNISFTK